MNDVQDEPIDLCVDDGVSQKLMEIRAARALSMTPHGVKQMPDGSWALAPAVCASLRPDVKAVIVSWALIVPASYLVALIEQSFDPMATAPSWFIGVVLTALVLALLIEHWSFKAYSVTRRRGVGAVEAVRRMGGVWARNRWNIPRVAVAQRNEAMSIGHGAMMLFFPALAGIYAALLYALGQKPSLLGIGLVLSVPVVGAVVMALGAAGVRKAMALGRKKAED